jgi:hypothetical protein
MIIRDSRMHFILIFSAETIEKASYGSDPASYLRYKGRRLTNKEYLEHWGKWIALDTPEKVEKWAEELDPYVEQGLIPCCKYDRTPLKELGLREECVLCVYCDDRERDEVLQILTKLGITPRAGRAWVYEREVIEKWSPGGVLMEKWLEAYGVKGEEAEKIREDARRRFKQQYGGEYDVAMGWDHGISSMMPIDDTEI